MLKFLQYRFLCDGQGTDRQAVNDSFFFFLFFLFQKQGLIPLHLTLDHDAVLYLNKYIIKVAKRDVQVTLNSVTSDKYQIYGTVICLHVSIVTPKKF